MGGESWTASVDRSTCRCIFCGTDLDADTKPEHVIPRAIGGRKSSTMIVCSGCNERLGSTVDNQLAKDLELICHQLDIRRQDGRSAPPIRHIPGHPEIVLQAGGKPVLRGPRPVVLGRPGPQGDASRWVARTIDEFVQTTLNELLRRKIPPGPDLRRRVNITPTWERTFINEVLPGRFSIGGDDTFRAVTKTAFEMFALRFPALALDQNFDEIREYVLNGAPSSCACWDFDTPEPVVHPAHGLADGWHRVLVWSASAGEPAVGIVNLFGVWRFSVELLRSWPHDPFVLVHVVDPVGGRILADDSLERVPGGLPVLGSGWADARSRDQNLDVLRAGLVGLHRTWTRRQNLSFIEDVVTEATEEIMQKEGWSDDTPLSPPEAGRLMAHIDKRVQQSQARVDVVEPMGEVEIEVFWQRVEAEYPTAWAEHQQKHVADGRSAGGFEGEHG